MPCFSVFANGPYLDPTTTTTSENILGMSSIKLWTTYMDFSVVLEDFIRGSTIAYIIYRLKSRYLWSSFGWSTMKKFSEVPALSIGSFQKVQREVTYFPFVVRKNVSDLSKKL